MNVKRLDGRVCGLFPAERAWDSVQHVFPEGPRSCRPSDDARDGMEYYGKGGGVVTWCGQYALTDNQVNERVNCLGCIASGEKG